MVVLISNGRAKRPGKYHRNGGDSRGNSYTRRRRKCKLLAIYGNDHHHACNECGESHPHKCNCVHCGGELTFTTLEQDRIVPGGRYVIENLQPSCTDCNKRRSNNPNWQRSTIPIGG